MQSKRSLGSWKMRIWTGDPAAFPKPVARAGIPFVSFQDPRATVVRGNASPYGSALVEPASAGR